MKPHKTIVFSSILLSTYPIERIAPAKRYAIPIMLNLPNLYAIKPPKNNRVLLFKKLIVLTLWFEIGECRKNEC